MNTKTAQVINCMDKGKVKYIGVCFDGYGAKVYTYKVPAEIPVNKDDKVLVNANDDFKVVTVVRISAEIPSGMLHTAIKYPEAILANGQGAFTEHQEREKRTSDIISMAEARKTQRSMIEEISQYLTIEEKQFLGLEQK